MSTCNFTNIIDGTECIGDSLYNKINPNFANLDNAVCALSSNKVFKAGDTMTGPLLLNADPTATLQAATKRYVDQFRNEILIDHEFNHLDNVVSVVNKGISPIQANFFPDTAFGAPAFKVANGPNIGKHWLTLNFTPTQSNYVVGEINFPIRTCCNEEDETSIYIFNVTTGIPTILTQQLLWNGSRISSGATIRVGFNMSVIAGVTHRLLVTTMANWARYNTWIVPGLDSYSMRMTGVTGNVSPWDAGILDLTNNANQFTKIRVFVAGINKI